MIITWHEIGVWAIGVLGTTVGNLITLAIVTSVTSTKWFKNYIVKLTDDWNSIKMKQCYVENKREGEDNVR